ncbi:hypothetical protein Y695_03859 [Hydrogenophaga sp. T4]|nr:hypothetical protein Y695_03859 [Hydrogenophaga sp. T4]
MSSSVSSSSIRGKRWWTSRSKGSASALEALCGMPNTTLPRGSSSVWRALCNASSACRRIDTAWGKKRCPASVSSTPRRER